MKKRPFYFSNEGPEYSMGYRTRNLRHQFIKWSIEKYGWYEDMPDQLWIVKLKWARSIIPGLRFREG